MSLLDMLVLSLKSGFSPLNFVIALVVGVVGGGLVFVMRSSVNRKWGGGVLSMTILGIVWLVVAISCMGMKGASSYLEKERHALEAELRDDPIWRNEALGRAWQKLNASDEQSGLVPPEEGGTDLRLSSAPGAQIYAEILAEVLREETVGRIDYPELAEFKPPQEVAAYVFDSNDMLTMEFPTVLNQDNIMANLAMEHRSGEYYTPYSKVVAESEGKMNFSLLVVAVASLVLSLGIVMWNAWRDLTKFDS